MSRCQTPRHVQRSACRSTSGPAEPLDVSRCLTLDAAGGDTQDRRSGHQSLRRHLTDKESGSPHESPNSTCPDHAGRLLQRARGTSRSSEGTSAHAHGAQQSIHPSPRRRSAARRSSPARSSRSGTACAPSGRTTSPGRVSAVISLLDDSPGQGRDRRPGCCGTRPTSATRSSPSTATRPANALTRRSSALHILIAADLIAAAKAGDDGKVAERAGAVAAATPPRSQRSSTRPIPRFWKQCRADVDAQRASDAHDSRGRRAPQPRLGAPTSRRTTASTVTRSAWPTRSPPESSSSSRGGFADS